MLLMALIVASHLYAPGAEGQLPGGPEVTVGKALALGSAAVAYFGLFLFFLSRRRASEIANLEKFTHRSRTRIEKLFIKAGFPDETMVDRLSALDAEIEAIRKEEIK